MKKTKKKVKNPQIFPMFKITSGTRLAMEKGRAEISRGEFLTLDQIKRNL